jgi:phenylalanyl-tRNA synthetase alpha chain
MESLDQLLAEAPDRVEAVTELEALSELETEIVGKKSLLAATRRGLGQLPPDERPKVGAQVHQVQSQLQALIDSRRSVLERAAEDRLLEQDRVDVTLEAHEPALGMHHVLTQTVDEIVDIFVGLGYQVAAGPEVELAWYNFDALNTPPTHPSRLESDTLYVEYGDPADEMLLRTHTSPMQARYMENNEPAVDENITFGDLKGTLAHFAREFFGADRKIRLLPHFFPFTEPSAEMHVSCFVCDGSGCRVCSGSGWIELMGCGMVDPNVFDAVGYDPEGLSGFAFGMGAERLAMVRHGISHIKHFYENDVRVLRQFT